MSQYGFYLHDCGSTSLLRFYVRSVKSCTIIAPWRTYLGNVLVKYVSYNRIYIADIKEILAREEQLLFIVLPQCKGVVFNIWVLDQLRAYFCASEIMLSNTVTDVIGTFLGPK